MRKFKENRRQCGAVNFIALLDRHGDTSVSAFYYTKFFRKRKEKCEKNTICLAGNHKISYNS